MILWNVLLFSRCRSGSSSGVGFFIWGCQFPQLIRNTTSVADCFPGEANIHQTRALGVFLFSTMQCNAVRAPFTPDGVKLLGKASVTRPWCWNSSAFSYSFLSSNSALNYSAHWLLISAKVTINKRLLERLCWSDQESWMQGAFRLQSALGAWEEHRNSHGCHPTSSEDRINLYQIVP